MNTIESVLKDEARWCVLTGKWQDVLSADLRVDHVITDPPYSEHVHSKIRAGARKTPLRDGNGNPRSKCAIDREVDFGFEAITQDEREACADMIEAACKRWALVFSDIESCHEWRTAFSVMEYCRTCLWHKIGGTPQFTGDRPASHAEAITCMHPRGRKRWNGGGKGNLYPALTVIERGGQRRGNNTRSHTTQKPLDLMLALVADFTDPGEVILDPYCGSGTTGVACLRLGRRFIGCEMDPTYAQVSVDRLTAEEQNTTLAAMRAGQLPLLGG